MKKLLMLVTVVIVAVLAVAGCANPTSTSPSPAATQNPSLAQTTSPGNGTAAAGAHAPALAMTAIDVGRGDALLVAYPNGKHVLVDAGGGYTAHTYVIPYLIQKGITHLEAIVCTHEHWDHIDGLTELLKDGRFTIDAAYDSGFPIVHELQTANSRERASIDSYLTQLTDKHIKREIVQAGDSIDVGRDRAPQNDTATFVLNPNAGLTVSLQKSVKDTQRASNHAAINENSLVLRIGYGQVHFMLAGDTSLNGSTYADAAMLADPVQGRHLASDVLKLGHHGFNAPDDAFYRAVNPRHVVMTFGPQLRTSEPYCEGLHNGAQNFNYFKTKFSLEIVSTCNMGTVTVTSDGTSNGIHVQTEASSVPQGCCCTCVNDHPSRDEAVTDTAT